MLCFFQGMVDVLSHLSGTPPCCALPRNGGGPWPPVGQYHSRHQPPPPATPTVAGQPASSLRARTTRAEVQGGYHQPPVALIVLQTFAGGVAGALRESPRLPLLSVAWSVRCHPIWGWHPSLGGPHLGHQSSNEAFLRFAGDQERQEARLLSKLHFTGRNRKTNQTRYLMPGISN